MFILNPQDENLCSMIAERTGESLEAIQNLSLEEKVHLAKALGLKQVLTSHP